MVATVVRAWAMAAMMHGANGRAWVHPEVRNGQEERIRKKRKRRRPWIQQSSPKRPEIRKNLAKESFIKHDQVIEQ